MLTLKNQTTNHPPRTRQQPIAKRVPIFAKDPEEAPIKKPLPQKQTPGTSVAKKPSNIPISDITGSRGLVSQKPILGNQTEGSKGSVPVKDPYVPISVVTGSRDITTVSPELRAFIRKGSPSAATAIPEVYADLANVLEKIGSDIDMKGWAKLSAKQQMAKAQRAGVSEKDLRILLNAAPHMVETIAKVQDVFAKRYDLGLSVDDARSTASDLFDIASERNDAISRTGKYANDAVFAPKALRWLDEEEEKILKNLQENTNEAGQNTWYNEGDSGASAKDSSDGSSPKNNPVKYIQVPGQGYIGASSNNAAVNCYGYILMTLGIETADGNYDVQPGMLSETRAGDHAYAEVFYDVVNKDIDTITDFIKRDFKKDGKSVREINSYTDATDNEVVVAIKTTNQDSIAPDYHCAVLLPDGSWADKPGIRSDSRVGVIKEPDNSWGNWLRKYDSKTVYVAISNP